MSVSARPQPIQQVGHVQAACRGQVMVTTCIPSLSDASPTLGVICRPNLDLTKSSANTRLLRTYFLRRFMYQQTLYRNVRYPLPPRARQPTRAIREPYSQMPRRLPVYQPKVYLLPSRGQIPLMIRQRPQALRV